MAISVVGVDLSKSVFQLSVADGKQHVIDRKRLSRVRLHQFLAQTPSTTFPPASASGPSSESAVSSPGVYPLLHQIRQIICPRISRGFYKGAKCFALSLALQRHLLNSLR
jgi:hypothetical protein